MKHEYHFNSESIPVTLLGKDFVEEGTASIPTSAAKRKSEHFNVLDLKG